MDVHSVGTLGRSCGCGLFGRCLEVLKGCWSLYQWLGLADDQTGPSERRAARERTEDRRSFDVFLLLSCRTRPIASTPQPEMRPSSSAMDFITLFGLVGACRDSVIDGKRHAHAHTSAPTSLSRF